MPNNYVTKSHFDEVIGTINKKLEKLDKIDKMSEQIDWMVGKIQGHEEEHTLLNNTVSEHSDNLETINGKLGIVI
ncbi:MAG: hypothetical protein UU15_C0042G0003 [Candidatus Levybacteria bacterium GW2011_GWC2_40_7]|nr:MAG: hypothetical protein UT26_C0044G0010 [Microgenomates group bacterium GW2011_GWC1_39_12]KKR71789.1 MAG: hypothetical protein UU15_C0042G0003 [Candidatus Levybacteria bacterium GW2011_GWC2_40_7]